MSEKVDLITVEIGDHYGRLWYAESSEYDNIDDFIKAVTEKFLEVGKN